jgi:hypothetical protein
MVQQSNHLKFWEEDCIVSIQQPHVRPVDGSGFKMAGDSEEIQSAAFRN